MKLSVLDMAQDIANDMNSDEFNSINDTVESIQIANIIRTTYFEILSDRDWPHLRTLMFADSSTDVSKPTHMKLPEDCQKIVTVKYNTIKAPSTPEEELQDNYEDVKYLHPDEFLDFIAARNSTADNIIKVTDSGITLLIANDDGPRKWTSFDDENMIFDSYDNEVDTTLQSSKFQIVGYREPTFTLEDSFIPDLPAKNFPYLLSEAKSVSFNVLAQEPNAKEEQRARRQRVWSSWEKFRTDGGIRFKNDYGRR